MTHNLVWRFFNKCSANHNHSSEKKRILVRRLMFDHLEQRTLLAGNVFGDFNGDGADDMAVGVPEETVSGHVNAGAVTVIYGLIGIGLQSGPTGPTSGGIGNQLWTQDSWGPPFSADGTSRVLDSAEEGDLFGASLAAGDFNNDGFDDLAIGVPGESVNGVAKAGAVNVLYGSATYLFLATTGQQFWHQDSSGILDSAGTTTLGDGEQFGFSLLAGDFNNDGADDLAIGVPNESSHLPNGGAVNVLYGTTGVGLTSAGNQIWHQDSSGIRGVTDAHEHFGFAVATGDFDHDGTDDLAVGAPGDVVSGVFYGAGGVNVIYGSTAGLTSAGNYLFTQNSSGVLDVAEDNDRFGFSLAVGNFNGDLQDDLAIGVPKEDFGIFGSTQDAGAVNVLYGGNREFELGPTGTAQLGLTAAGNQFWNQDSSGILDWAETIMVSGRPQFGDHFGASLAAGDFNGDLRDDLAIGVPSEPSSATTIQAIEMGAVNVIMGTANGLNSAGNQFWTQDSSGIQDFAETGDKFGAAVSVGDFDADGYVDLAISAPGQSVPSKALPGTTVPAAGVVHVIMGSATSLNSARSQLWSQNSSGILGEANAGDHFGEALLGSSLFGLFS